MLNWLALVICVFLMMGSRQVSSTPGGCLTTAIDSGRRLFETQEKFYMCYKDCTRSIVSSSNGNPEKTPDFTSNFLVMAKSAGMSLCSKLCFDKISDVLPPGAASKPMSAFSKIGETLINCLGADPDKSNNYITELARFNMDNLNHSPTFEDPRPMSLFSIFYPDFLQLFWSAVDMFEESSKTCPEAIAVMKSSLSAYTNGLNLCQHFCLISFASSTNLDLFSKLVSVAKCQHSCFYLFRSDPTPDKSLLHPVSEIHHFLQYCLWHTGARSLAVAHAASFSLLEPNDKSLSEYYIGGENVPESDFVPKSDAVHLQEQLDTLNEIIKTGSTFDEMSPSKLAAVVKSLKNYDMVETTNKLNKTKTETVAPSGTCDATGCGGLNVDKINVVANLSGIENHRRYIVDNVLDQSQCERLVGINKKAGTPGDGYTGTKKYGSPYTDHESYVGLAAVRLAELVSNGVLAPEEISFYLGVVDNVLQKTKRLHGLKELYVHFVHLVCRSFVEEVGKRDLTKDPSHPLHSDNCGILENGDCIDNDPVVTPRNYTAVLYLNDEFEGGEIYFSHRPNMAEEGSIYPHCGRLVSFQSGEYHGVRALTKGTRCSFAMWFTMDKSKEERHSSRAREALANLAALETEDIPLAPTGPDRM